jgi:hypothetical protein
MNNLLLIVLACLLCGTFNQQAAIANAISGLFNNTNKGYNQSTQYSQKQTFPLTNSQISSSIAQSLLGNSSSQNKNYQNSNINPNFQISNNIASSLVKPSSSPVNSMLASAIVNNINQTVNNKDNAFIKFLLASNIPNATVMPTLQ